MPHPRRVAITGAGGFVGTALAQALRAAGCEVRRLVRSAEDHPEAVVWHPATGALDVARLGAIDGVVHLAGSNVAAGRWTAARKRAIADSRGPVTEALCRTLAALPQRPAVLVSASATGFYGDRGDEPLDDRSAAGAGFLATVARAWEHATEPAAAAGIRVVNLRIGLVLDPAGGALRRMLLPFRLGLGGKLGDGRQWTSWITRHDLVRAIRFALQRDELRGPVVATTPHPVTNRDFTRTLGRVVRRPTFARLPAFVLRVLFGEMGEALLLASQRAYPGRLAAAGFQWDRPELEDALRTLLLRAPEPADPDRVGGGFSEPAMQPNPTLAAAALTLAAAIPAQAPPADAARRLVDAINAFAADLHPRLVAAKAPTSSPASIAIALAMLLPGARGATADELATVLRLPPDLRGEALHAAVDELMQGLGLASPVPREREWQLRITNDLWAQSGHAIVDAYATTLRRAFHAGCHAVAFRSDPDGVRQAINAHVAKATKDRIRDLLSAEHVTADTRVVLTNALWLKATWAEEFYNRATKPAPFTLASGERVEVPMMRRTGHHGYAETADWQCLVMAFRGGELVCEVMLPRAGKSLALAEQVLLTGAHRRGIASARVAVHLPRFRVESGAGLRATLAAMGLRTTFVPMVADFTGVSPEGQLVVGDVVHRAWIDLNEDGVEAAAATAAAMTVGSAMPAKEQPPIPFVAERPFAFTLRHQASGLVLFVGRVDDPRPRQRG